MTQATIGTRARALYDKAIVSDLTLPFTYRDRYKALERFFAHGFTHVGVTVSGDRADIKTTVLRIGEELNHFDRLRDKYLVAESVEDILAAKRAGKLAITFAFQGSNALEANLTMVRTYYKLGVRWMLLAYNQRNPMADGCHERTDSGLSRLGQQLVDEMNRVGMLIDCTHTGRRSALDILERSSLPCIFSHSVCDALHHHERNITDEQIRACAATGGVVGVNGIGFFLNAEDDPSIDQMYRHIDHIAQLVGVRHVAIGLDLVYFEDEMYALYEANKDVRYPTGYPPPPWHYFQPESLLGLVDHLLSRGYSEDDVNGILGRNFLRVAASVWK